jgi:biotin carboxyl carrier protein
MRFTYEHQGRSYVVDITRKGDFSFVALVEGREYTLDAEALANGAWLLRHNDAQTLAHVAVTGKERAIHLDGQHYTFAVADERKSRRASKANRGDLTAQMPGQITDVRVNEGDVVTVGQVLLVMEAMKMEIRVSAPTEGTVSRLYVKKGDLVQRGQTLIDVQAQE